MTDPSTVIGAARDDESDAEAFELKVTPRPAESAAPEMAPAATALPETATPETAFESVEALVIADPGDDALRARYLEMAAEVGAELRAANTLARAAGANEAAVRERVWFDAATLYMREAELPQARSAFMQSVLAGAAGPAGLAAALRVLDLEVEPADPEVIAPALAVIAQAHSEPASRRDAGRRLLALHAITRQENARLAVALQALAEAEALDWVTSLHERDPERAVALCRIALEADPASAEWLGKIDEWIDSGEAPADRIARYEAALTHATTSSHRLPLLRKIAAIRRDAHDVLKDPPAAVEVWQRILQEAPSDREAIEALMAASTDIDDGGATLAAIARARPSLKGRDRHELTLRTARALSRQGDRAEAVAMCRELLDDPSASPATLQAVAEIAHDEDDPVLYRSTLEVLTRVGGAESKKRALERLGDFQFTQLRDPRAAAEYWRPAAQMCEAAPGEQAHAQSLYERVLEALPDDRDAAQHLTAIYRQSNDWAKLPDVLRVLIRTDADDAGEGSASPLLLDLEKSAIEAGAAEEYSALLDSVLTSGAGGAGSAERSRTLKRARARALSSDAARRDQASLAYRELIESFALEEDVRDFEGFVESRSSARERHLDRRWLCGWRAGREARPTKLLLDWAKSEEEFGEADAAMAVYQRLVDLEPGRRDALEALGRLKLEAGDHEGGLTALRALRDMGSESERRNATLRMARLLLEEMGRPAEAVLVLVPLFAVVPPIAMADQMIQRTLADAAARGPLVERLEQLANDADPATCLRVYEFLVKAREETAAMTSARRRWVLRVVELTADRPAALRAALEGAIEQPEAIDLWETAETLARTLGQAKPAEQAEYAASVSRAYHRVLVKGTPALPAALAETLARRMDAFEGEYGAGSARLVEALQRTLELSPGARWAIDRVKLMLGSQARWDELFHIYDRAIAAATDARGRAALLDEAAFAAKDLAGQPERATGYLESIHALRPEDAAVDSALERLYEKLGRTSALIELLSQRLTRSTGFHHRELLHKIASLWLDLGRLEQAVAVVDRMLADSAPIAELVDPLERVVAGPDGVESFVPAKKRAIALLRAHYEGASQIDDVVRMAERELALTVGAEERSRCVRDLVGLRLAAAERAGGAGVFAQVVPRIESDVKGDAPLAKIAFEALLQRTLVAWKQPASPARDDAAEGAWRAIHALKTLLVEGGKGEAALNLLTRCSKLPFERTRRRELVREAALVCADRLVDPARAIRTFGELFEEEGGDDVAARSLQRFAALLEKAGELPRLATLWEAQSLVHEATGKVTEQRACWERAARLWERHEDVDKAVTAYGRAGALGSHAAFEALARLHSQRGSWLEAAEALEWLVAHSPGQVRGLRALELAEACVKLGDRSRARARLESALAAGIEPERVEQVPERLITLYREDAAWRPLARLLAAQARRPGHAERRLAWLREASELHWRKLEEPAEAAALLEVAVSWYPQDVTLRPALADVLEALGQWEKAATVLRDQVGLHRDQRSKERARVHHRLAHALERAGHAEDALTELRLAAEMQPANPAILFDLGRTALAADKLDLAESTYRALLLALHRSNDETGADADANAEPGEPGSLRAPHRSEVFLELSEIAARRNDTGRAVDLVDSAVDAALESGEDPARFEGPLGARGRHDLLARAIERRVERAATLSARASALSDLATLWAERLERAADLGGRLARHAERMGRELEHEGLTDAAAWTALASAHRAIGDESARLATVQRRAALLETAIPNLPRGAERNRLRVELATTLLEDPARSDAAVALLSSTLEEDSENAEAADRLGDALERLERFDELVVVLDRRLLRAPKASGTWIETAWRLGKALERAGRPRNALPVYESVVDRLASSESRPDSTDRPWLGALVDRLAALGSARLADGLERMLVAGGDVALAERLLDLRDRAGDATGARRALELGFAVDPGNASFFRRLVDAYRDAGDPAGTLRLLDPAVAARPDDVDLLIARAGARESLGDDDGALFDLETAAVAEVRHADALLALHERVLVRQTERAQGGSSGGRLPATADAYAIRVVDVLLHTKRFDDARRELDRLLARNPAQAAALERIAALHGADGKWDLAVEAYRRLLPIVEADDADQGDHGEGEENHVRVVLSMADACERAGDAGAAREALERALSKAPASDALTQRLARVCEITGDVARLAHLLVSHAERAQTPDERARLFVRAGNLFLESAQDPAAALGVAEQARAADGDSHEAVLLWATAQRQLGRPLEALGVLHGATARARGKRTPLLARLHLEAAKSHLALDEVVEGFEALKAGFNLDWRNAEIAMLLGLVAIDLDDEKLAERALSGLTASPSRDASGASPDAALQANAFYRLALMAQAKGDRGKARRMATRALGADASHAASRAMLDQIEPVGGSPANRSGPRPAIR